MSTPSIHPGATPEAAVILDTSPRGKTRWVKALGSRSGLLTAVLNAGPPAAGKAGHCQPFNLVSLAYRRRKGTCYLTECHTLEDFPQVKASYIGALRAGYAANIVSHGLPEAEPQPGVFNALICAINYALTPQQGALSLRRCELSILAAAGINLNLRNCASCGSPYPKGEVRLTTAQTWCRQCCITKGLPPRPEAVTALNALLQHNQGQLNAAELYAVTTRNGRRAAAQRCRALLRHHLDLPLRKGTN